MDEFTSIGVWLFIMIISINAGIIYLVAQPSFATTDLAPKLLENTYFDTYNYSIPSGTTDDDISSTEPTISGSWLSDMISSAVTAGNTVRVLLTAWTDLLSAVLGTAPGGAFFANIILPIIGIVQIFAFFVIGIRVAGVIRGVI